MQREGSYRVHKSPVLIPILSQMNPANTTPSYQSKINPNIIIFIIEKCKAMHVTGLEGL
jgi:hypothetical protein